MAILKVKAAAGLRFPTEHSAKNYITEDPVDVESSAYYRRAIADGDLILVPVTPPAAPAAKVKAAGTGPVDTETNKVSE